MSRAPEKQRMVSILNNDDNPSFAVRPSKSCKIRQEHSTQTQQLQNWPTSVKGTPRTGSVSHKDYRLYRGDEASIPDSHPYSYGRQSQVSSSPPQYEMSQDPSSGYGQYKRGSASYFTEHDRHIGEQERLSPGSSYSSVTDYAAPPTAKKNKHACPYAASHGCSATFTTSGHAARHGKKHTGEKRVHCPVCNKAFTRKDNMKQHQRTHRESGADTDFEGQDHGITDTQLSRSPSSIITQHSAYDMDGPIEPRQPLSRHHSNRSVASYDMSPRYKFSELPSRRDHAVDRQCHLSVYRSDSISSGLDSLEIATRKPSHGRR